MLSFSQRRVLAAMVDQICMTIIVMIFLIPYFIYKLRSNNHSAVLFHENSAVYAYIVYIGIAVYYVKDSIYGQSAGKRLVHLQLVNNNSGKIAGPFRCFIRNLSVVLFPIEIIFIVVNPARRIGDFLAGTKIINYEPPLASPPSIKIFEIVISFLCAYALVVGFTLLTFI